MNTPIQGFPKHRLDTARAELAKSHARIARAALKTGQTAPALPDLVVIDEYVISRCTECHVSERGFVGGTCVICRKGHMISRNVLDLELRCERLTLAGWDFLAVVEPLDGGNLIRQVPSAVVTDGELAQWRTGSIVCTHCNTIRRRTETFIVRADGSDSAVAVGTYVQVGRNCLAAFLGGKSAAAVIWALTLEKTVRDFCDGEGGGWSGSQVYDPAEFMALVAAVSRLDGFLSKKAADVADVESTSAYVLGLMGPLPLDGADKARAARERCAPTADDIIRGSAALSWARALTGASDYERNLQIVAAQFALNTRHAGILASAYQAHARVLGDEVSRRAKAAAPSAHYGAVDDKVELKLTVERCYTTETQYGALHINTLRGADGTCFIWKTGRKAMQAGSTVLLTGKIKVHSEYRGEKQTELTRCNSFTVEEWAARAALKAAPKAKRVRKVKAAGPIAERRAADRDALSCTGAQP